MHTIFHHISVSCKSYVGQIGHVGVSLKDTIPTNQNNFSKTPPCSRPFYHSILCKLFTSFDSRLVATETGGRLPLCVFWKQQGREGERQKRQRDVEKRLEKVTPRSEVLRIHLTPTATRFKPPTSFQLRHADAFGTSKSLRNNL